ncbi:hypothetical protein PHYSODRAFT_364761, partial [Phytophthora sojae]
MKMSIVAIALALVCLVSFVFAANQPTTMDAAMSADERMQLAKKIKEVISSNPSAVDPAIAAMSTEDFFKTLSGLVSNPAVLTHASGFLKAATSGDVGAMTSHATSLLGAVFPAAVAAKAGTAPAA